MFTAAAPAPSVVESIVRRAYEIFNARAWDELASIYADDTEIVVVPTGETLRGVDGAARYTGAWVAAFGDAHTEVERIAAAGDVAVCEFRGVGTHSGVFHTPAGDLAPTGRQVNVPFCEVMRVRDGHIVSIHTYFDSAAFARQLQG